jgi:hypothetical protein
LQITNGNPEAAVVGACQARSHAAVLALFALIACAVLTAAPEKTRAQLPVLAAAAPDRPADLAAGCGATSDRSQVVARCREPERLIVIGFMGGRVHAGNPVHKEALLARDLDRLYPNAIYAATYANHHESDALRTVLHLLDVSKNGSLSPNEKSAARIVIYGHSWGGSETVNFARVLGRLGIPVLLTIQVDSVEKSGENDGTIPPNVRDAINFYQEDGLLHGRSSIQAANPRLTTIMGNYESSYKSHPVSCAGFSWYARAFMKPHIEIENDSAVWDRIEALILTRLRTPPTIAAR